MYRAIVPTIWRSKAGAAGSDAGGNDHRDEPTRRRSSRPDRANQAARIPASPLRVGGGRSRPKMIPEGRLRRPDEPPRTELPANTATDRHPDGTAPSALALSGRDYPTRNAPPASITSRRRSGTSLRAQPALHGRRPPDGVGPGSDPGWKNLSAPFLPLSARAIFHCPLRGHSENVLAGPRVLRDPFRIGASARLRPGPLQAVGS